MQNSPCEDVDLWALEVRLAMTRWERMQANDDALRCVGAVRRGVEKRECKT